MIIHNLDEMHDFARGFLQKKDVNKKQATIVLLNGDLGSGKTAFTKAIAKELGIDEHITSPTFVIQKEYDIPNHTQFKKLIHIDAYRLDGSNDLQTLDWKQTIQDSENLVFVEWPEIVGLTSKNTQATTLDFSYIDEGTRKIAF